MLRLSDVQKKQRDRERIYDLKGESGGGSISGGGGGGSGGLTVVTHAEVDHDGLPGVGNAKAFHLDFAGTDVIVVNHNLGLRPMVQVIGNLAPLYGQGLYGAGMYGGNPTPLVITPASIAHNSINQVTVTLSSADTGEVICVG